MTYMFENPTYLPIPLSRSIQVLYPRYGLYSYCEGARCESHRRNKFSGSNDCSPMRTNSINFLFQGLRFCSLLAMLIVTVKCVHWARWPIAWRPIRIFDWISSPLISMKNSPPYSEGFWTNRPNSWLIPFKQFCHCTKRRKLLSWWEIPLAAFLLVGHTTRREMVDLFERF